MPTLLDSSLAPVNLLLNSSFDWWQRMVTSISGTSYAYSMQADRWLNVASAGSGGTLPTATIGQLALDRGQTDVPGNSGLAYRFNYTTVGTSLAADSWNGIGQRVENPWRLSGKKVTLSFYARSSIANKTVGGYAVINNGSGNSAFVQFPQVTLTSTFKRYTMTVTIPDLSGITWTNTPYMEIGVMNQMGSNTAALYGQTAFGIQATGTVDFAAMMLTEGHMVTDYRRAGDDALGDLELCKRYCQVVNGTGGTQATFFGFMNVNQATVEFIYHFPVQMRATPTARMFNTSAVYFHKPGINTGTGTPSLSVSGGTPGYLRMFMAGAPFSSAANGDAEVSLQANAVIFESEI